MDGLITSEFAVRYRQRLLEIQDEMLKGEQVECPLLHDFAPGVYTRRILMPADSFVIGATHKTEHLNMALSGSAYVMMDGEITFVKAPAVIKSKAGQKKCFRIVEEMIWATIHPTDETDLDKLESDLVMSVEEEDYWRFLSETGITERDVQKVVQDESSRLHFLEDVLELRDSKIQGTGVFAKGELPEGEFVARTEEGKKTDLGRYANHSGTPSCTPFVRGNSMIFKVGKGLDKDEELTVDYRDSRELAIEMEVQLCLL